MFEMDSQEKIVLAKIYSILGKYFDRIIRGDETAEIILKCSGLSSMFEKYEEKLTPYTMNGSWKNDNPNYTPIKTCFAICREIENNKQALGTFLKEILVKLFAWMKKILQF